MEEHFWQEYETECGMKDFVQTFGTSSKVVRGTNIDDEHYQILFSQKGVTTVIDIYKNDYCRINGMNTGKKFWVKDIKFSTDFDQFGGMLLVLKDDDYMSVRMDGKILSFMCVPFEQLSKDISYDLRKVMKMYEGDWRDHI